MLSVTYDANAASAGTGAASQHWAKSGPPLEAGPSPETSASLCRPVHRTMLIGQHFEQQGLPPSTGNPLHRLESPLPISAGLFTEERPFDSIWNNEGCLPALGVPCLFHYLRALRLLSITVNEQQRTVDVGLLWGRAHAKYLGSHFGCQLKHPGQVSAGSLTCLMVYCAETYLAGRVPKSCQHLHQPGLGHKSASLLSQGTFQSSVSCCMPLPGTWAGVSAGHANPGIDPACLHTHNHVAGCHIHPAHVPR